MKLRTLIITAALTLCLSVSVGAKEATLVDVHYNDWAMPISGYLENGTTYVPVRRFFDLLGGSWVTWDNASRSATVHGNASGTFYQNSRQAELDGRSRTLTGTSYLSGGTLYVPLRGISEMLDCDISYDGKAKRVSLSKEKSSSAAVRQEDVYWLSRIIHAESGGEPYQGKLAVGNVILNRVADQQFPDSIYEVIFDRKYGVQFTPVANGTIYNTPSAESIRAAQACLAGTKVVEDCLYFFNPQTATKVSWIVENRKFYTSIGGHDFYQ